MKHHFFALLVVCLFVRPASSDPPINIHNAMMESTFALIGKNGNQLTCGTGFIICRPFATADGQECARFTLVTANHVLDGMKDDKAILQGRRLKEGTTEEWEGFTLPFEIRKNGTPLWTKHPDVDLAAMYVRVPDRTIRNELRPGVLFKDEDLRHFELGPGTELLCLGYPHGRMSKAGFPILRSGMIASYPIVPTKETKGFLFDFNIFPGNSGGPVYLYQVNPVYGGKTHEGQRVKGIVGVVTSQLQQPQIINRGLAITPLGIGEVIHASFIVELLDQLPDPNIVDDESEDKADSKTEGEKPPKAKLDHDAKLDDGESEDSENEKKYDDGL